MFRNTILPERDYYQNVWFVPGKVPLINLCKGVNSPGSDMQVYMYKLKYINTMYSNQD